MQISLSTIFGINLGFEFLTVADIIGESDDKRIAGFMIDLLILRLVLLMTE